MGLLWGDDKWRAEGRTGDGAAAPQYKNRRDRNRVRQHKDSEIGKPGLLGRIFGSDKPKKGGKKK